MCVGVGRDGCVEYLKSYGNGCGLVEGYGVDVLVGGGYLSGDE